MHAVDVVAPQHDFSVLPGRRGDAEKLAAHTSGAEPDPDACRLHLDLVRLALGREAEPLRHAKAAEERCTALHVVAPQVHLNSSEHRHAHNATHPGAVRSARPTTRYDNRHSASQFGVRPPARPSPHVPPDERERDRLAAALRVRHPFAYLTQGPRAVSRAAAAALVEPHAGVQQHRQCTPRRGIPPSGRGERRTCVDQRLSTTGTGPLSRSVVGLLVGGPARETDVRGLRMSHGLNGRGRPGARPAN